MLMHMTADKNSATWFIYYFRIAAAFIEAWRIKWAWLDVRPKVLPVTVEDAFTWTQNKNKFSNKNIHRGRKKTQTQARNDGEPKHSETRSYQHVRQNQIRYPNKFALRQSTRQQIDFQSPVLVPVDDVGGGEGRGERERERERD